MVSLLAIFVIILLHARTHTHTDKYARTNTKAYISNHSRANGVLECTLLVQQDVIRLDISVKKKSKIVTKHKTLFTQYNKQQILQDIISICSLQFAWQNVCVLHARLLVNNAGFCKNALKNRFPKLKTYFSMSWKKWKPVLKTHHCRLLITVEQWQKTLEIWREVTKWGVESYGGRWLNEGKKATEERIL